jgi:plasmid stabilization system protein ParE
MKVRFDPDADADLDRIFTWIAKDNTAAADEMMGRIEERIAPLAAPGLDQIGRLGLVKGTRELVEYPYIIVYRNDEAHNEVIVLAIFHCAQDR